MRRVCVALVWLVVASSCVAAVGCGRVKRSLYEGFGRDDWQHPERVVESLKLRPGDRVADVGAGGGYFTFRLAEAVGAKGQVFAVDVDESMVRHLNERVARDAVSNVVVIRGEYDDPLLPDGAIDLVFMSNTYHHIQERPQYFARLRSDLAPDGRVAILEYKPGGWIRRLLGHGTAKETIERELSEAGYRPSDEYTYLSQQNFLIYRPAGD